MNWKGKAKTTGDTGGKEHGKGGEEWKGRRRGEEYELRRTAAVG